MQISRLFRTNQYKLYELHSKRSIWRCDVEFDEPTLMIPIFESADEHQPPAELFRGVLGNDQSSLPLLQSHRYGDWMIFGTLSILLQWMNAE